MSDVICFLCRLVSFTSLDYRTSPSKQIDIALARVSDMLFFMELDRLGVSEDGLTHGELYRLREQNVPEVSQPHGGAPEDTGQPEAVAESWQMFANCLGVDSDLFFPERGASQKEAKEVCQGCVVREYCLEYALANGERFGIWGGLSERERRRIRRQRALARIAQQTNDEGVFSQQTDIDV